jgi:uncharacterized protein
VRNLTPREDVGVETMGVASVACRLKKVFLAEGGRVCVSLY